MPELAHKIKFPIKLKLIILTSFILLLALSVYLYMAMDLFEKDKSAYIYETGLISVETMSHEIGTILDEQTNSLKMLGKIYSKVSTEETKNFDFLVDAFNSRADLADFLVIGNEGKVLYQVMDKNALKSYDLSQDHFRKLATSEKWPLEEIKRRGLFIKNMVSGEKSDFPHLLLGYYDQEHSMAFIGRFLVSGMVELLSQKSIYETFAIDSLGRPYAHKGKSLMKSGKSLMEESYIESIVNGQSKKGVKEVKNSNGESLLVSFVNLNRYNLYLISQIQKSKAFLSLRFLIEKSVFSGIFIISGAIILIILFARRFSKPIEALSNATVAVAGGDFSSQITVRTNDELGVLSHSFNKMSKKLLHYIEEVKVKAELEKELEVAKLVQDSFFPESNININGIHLSSYYSPASTCGGDWWGFIPNGDDLVVLIGDATGHGVPSALITATVNSTAYGLKEINPEALKSPAKIMRFLNKSVCQVGSDILMTFFVVVVNSKKGILTYSNAGHNPPIFYDSKEEGPSKESLNPLLGANGQRLGINPICVYQEKEISYKNGDGLFLFTDGILEAKNKSNEEWGNRRFLRLLGKNFNLPADELNNLILSKAEKFLEGVPPDDDVTMITLKFNEQARPQDKVYLNTIKGGKFNNIIKPLENLGRNFSADTNDYACNGIIVEGKTLEEEKREFGKNIDWNKVIAISDQDDEFNATRILNQSEIYHLVGANSPNTDLDWLLFESHGDINIENIVSAYKVNRKEFSSSRDLEIRGGALLDDTFSQMGKHLDKVKILLNELLTNAIFNAPVDDDKKPKYQLEDRKEIVELDGHEHVQVEAGIGEKIAYLKIRDNFGELTRDTLVQYIANGFSKGKASDKCGGAGLGLFFVYKFSNKLIVRRKAGEWMEITVLIEHIKRNKHFTENITSFHYFEV